VTEYTLPADEKMADTQINRLSPWRWAESLESCWLFWLPVNSGTVPEFQKEWLLEFFSRFASRVKTLSDLDEQHFMQMKTIDANPGLRQAFLNGIMKESPLTGLSNSPGQTAVPSPAIPTMKEAQAFANKQREFKPQDYMPEQACWFVTRNGGQLKQKYLGYGGMTVLFVKPDMNKAAGPPPASMNGPLIIPKVFRNDKSLKPLLEGFDPKEPAKIPSFLREHPGMKQVFSVFDVEGVKARPATMLSPFRDKSKEIFGEGMDHDLKFEAQPFILPRLTSSHFFSHTSEQVRRWFELFDVYLAESPSDEGIIMACKDNLTSLVADLTDEMRSDGYHYWEG
jgi:hypothetical protein